MSRTFSDRKIGGGFVTSARMIRFAALAAVVVVWLSVAMFRVGASRAADSGSGAPLDGVDCTLTGTDPGLNTGKAATNDYTANGSTQSTFITPTDASNQL